MALPPSNIASSPFQDFYYIESSPPQYSDPGPISPQETSDEPCRVARETLNNQKENISPSVHWTDPSFPNAMDPYLFAFSIRPENPSIEGSSPIINPPQKTFRASCRKVRNHISKKTDAAAQRCFHCNTRTTAQWRRGPNGPGTLCNACGLRNTKFLKRKDNGERNGSIDIILNGRN